MNIVDVVQLTVFSGTNLPRVLYGPRMTSNLLDNILLLTGGLSVNSELRNEVGGWEMGVLGPILTYS